jgi:hypothetical protein
MNLLLLTCQWLCEASLIFVETNVNIGFEDCPSYLNGGGP